MKIFYTECVTILRWALNKTKHELYIVHTVYVLIHNGMYKQSTQTHILKSSILVFYTHSNMFQWMKHHLQGLHTVPPEDDALSTETCCSVCKKL